MSCDETFSAGICYVTDAYGRVCRFNDELRADLEECRAENAKLRFARDTWAENDARLRELVRDMYRDMQGVLDMSTDTVWVDDIGTLRDEMDCHMQDMAELGMPPADYERRMRELGIEVGE